ncbi:MAG: hypothetical protein WBQ93_01945 [Candidatus Competibacter sp.]|nr:hypothetical protein [Candidatus Competibacteraceae bacterium]
MIVNFPLEFFLQSNFAQYYPVEDPLFGKNQLMDKRGAGVRLILKRSEALSGKRPVYQNLSDMELKLTIFAAPPPAQQDATTDALNPTATA